MKITGASVLAGLQRPVDVRGKKAGTGDLSRSSDVFEASERAKEYGVARKGIAQVSDVREAVVANLQTRIAKGEYKINPYDIASKLVDARI